MLGGGSMDLKGKLELMEYHIQLLLRSVNIREFPLEAYIIKNKLSETEVENILITCERLTEKLNEQKKEGLMWFETLLIEFQHELPSSCNINELISVLISKGMFIDLMSEFKKLLRHGN
jgi:hypothetical protein